MIGYWQQSNLNFQPEITFQLNPILDFMNALKIGRKQVLGKVQTRTVFKEVVTFFLHRDDFTSGLPVTRPEHIGVPNHNLLRSGGHVIGRRVMLTVTQEPR
jgi:hypothetical protein